MHAYGYSDSCVVRILHVLQLLSGAAPAIEHSTGVFVAGNALKNLGSAGELGDSLAPSNTRESLVSSDQSDISTAGINSGFAYEEHVRAKQQQLEGCNSPTQEATSPTVPAVAETQPQETPATVPVAQPETPATVPVAQPETPAAVPEVGKTDLPEQPGKLPSQDLGGNTGAESVKGTEPSKSERAPEDEVSMDESEIPLGHSPGQSAKSVPNKYDKFYHQ